MPEQENIQDAGDSQEAGSSNKDKKHDSGAADLEKVASLVKIKEQVKLYHRAQVLLFLKLNVLYKHELKVHLPVLNPGILMASIGLYSYS